MTTTGVPSPDGFWNVFAQELPKFSERDQQIALAIYRELANGRPLSDAQMAAALNLRVRDAQEALASDSIRCFTYRDGEGRIAGFGGLATAPMPHRFEIDGRTLWTWCAWDSLFIPELLGEAARVQSTDPETGGVVRLTVSPDRVGDVEPAGVRISFLFPQSHDLDTSATNVMARFCHFVFFFTTSESGERWTAKHPGTFLLSIEEAFALGRRLNHQNFGQALARMRDEAVGARAGGEILP